MISANIFRRVIKYQIALPSHWKREWIRTFPCSDFASKKHSEHDTENNVEKTSAQDRDLEGHNTNRVETKSHINERMKNMNLSVQERILRIMDEKPQKKLKRPKRSKPLNDDDEDDEEEKNQARMSIKMIERSTYFQSHIKQLQELLETTVPDRDEKQYAKRINKMQRHIERIENSKEEDSMRNDSNMNKLNRPIDEKKYAKRINKMQRHIERIENSKEEDWMRNDSNMNKLNRPIDEQKYAKRINKMQRHIERIENSKEEDWMRNDSNMNESNRPIDEQKYAKRINKMQRHIERIENSKEKDWMRNDSNMNKSNRPIDEQKYAKRINKMQRHIERIENSKEEDWMRNDSNMNESNRPIDEEKNAIQISRMQRHIERIENSKEEDWMRNDSNMNESNRPIDVEKNAIQISRMQRHIESIESPTEEDWMRNDSKMNELNRRTEEELSARRIKRMQEHVEKIQNIKVRNWMEDGSEMDTSNKATFKPTPSVVRPNIEPENLEEILEILNNFSPSNKMRSHSDTNAVSMEIWDTLAARDLQLKVTYNPRSPFEEMIMWTEKGTMWKFPVNNEEGLVEEENVHFSEHIFLDQHLEEWCPKVGPIRHYMELVCVGLSKNPYFTVNEKVAHIKWYQNYFTNQMELLEKVGAWDSNTTPQLEESQSTDQQQSQAM